MTESFQPSYVIQRTESTLVFRTAHFTAEKGSVLHSDIYNRELTSVLASMVLAGAVYLILSVVTGRTISPFIISAFVFVLSFPLFRTFVFKGRYMEAVFNTDEGTAVLTVSRTLSRKREEFPLGNIRDVSVVSKTTGIENPDGVAFVEKISAQHGMVIPGFGEETTFFILKLSTTDGTERTIFAESDRDKVLSAQNEIREFLAENK